MVIIIKRGILHCVACAYSTSAYGTNIDAFSSENESPLSSLPPFPHPSAYSSTEVNTDLITLKPSWKLCFYCCCFVLYCHCIWHAVALKNISFFTVIVKRLEPEARRYENVQINQSIEVNKPPTASREKEEKNSHGVPRPYMTYVQLVSASSMTIIDINKGSYKICSKESEMNVNIQLFSHAVFEAKICI